MNPIEYRFSLDMQSTCTQKVIPMKQGDNGQTLIVTLMQSGKPYTIADGCYAVFSTTKPDGNPILNNCAICENAIEISYEITEQTTAAVGILNCEIMLYDENSKLITSPTFVIIVESKQYKDGTLNSTSEFTVLTDLLARLETLGVQFASRCVEVTLAADKWDGDNNLYSQIVTIDGTTEYSKVDLLPSAEQLAIFHDKDIAFVTENENGVITVYVIGDKPANDYTMQAMITEVKV